MTGEEGSARAADDAAVADSSIDAPRRVDAVVGGRYRVVGVLGRGAFGVTYLAEQVAVGRRVAIKQIIVGPSVPRLPIQDGEGAHTGDAVHAGVTTLGGDTVHVDTGRSHGTDGDHPATAELVVREARTLARFKSGAIVRVLDAFTEAGDGFVVMEHVEGSTLRVILGERGGPLTAHEVQSIAADLCGALGEIHAAGVLHRDVKPSNVMIRPDGHAVLIDFGTASEHRADRTNTTGGTIDYAAPEQWARHTRIGPPADVYGLAATLYEASTGTAPVGGIARRLEGGSVPAPQVLNPDVTATVSDAIVRAMALDPAERTPTAAALLADMRGEGARPLTRRHLLAGVAAVVVTVGGGAAAQRFLAGRSAPNRYVTVAAHAPFGPLPDELVGLALPGDGAALAAVLHGLGFPDWWPMPWRGQRRYASVLRSLEVEQTGARTRRLTSIFADQGSPARTGRAVLGVLAPQFTSTDLASIGGSSTNLTAELTPRHDGLAVADSLLANEVSAERRDGATEVTVRIEIEAVGAVPPTWAFDWSHALPDVAPLGGVEAALAKLVLTELGPPAARAGLSASLTWTVGVPAATAYRAHVADGGAWLGAAHLDPSIGTVEQPSFQLDDGRSGNVGFYAASLDRVEVTATVETSTG